MDKVRLRLKSMEGVLCLVLSGLLTSCELTEPQKTIQLESRSDNTLWVIHPYRDRGIWVFDDPRVGLRREPFVAGIPEMMDKLVVDIPNADKGFRLLFSATPFPWYRTKLVWRREEAGGNRYFSADYDAEGWLCPALFKYFKTAPKEIYVAAKRGKLRSE